MPGPQFRHHNSPDEIAKRDASAPVAPEKPKGFRHWNHPDEVAKRARAAAGETEAPAQTSEAPAVSEKPAIELPSPAAAGAGVVSVAMGHDPEPVAPPREPSGMARLRQLEQRFEALESSHHELLDVLFGPDEANPEELRKVLRQILLDFPMVKESQLNLAARTRALATAIGLEWHPDGALGAPLPPSEDPPLFPGLDATATPPKG